MKHLLTISLLTILVFSACNTCLRTDCAEGLVCEDGACVCPEGTTSAECEQFVLNAYLGNHMGRFECSSNYYNDFFSDKIYITSTNEENVLCFREMETDVTYNAVFNSFHTFTIPLQIFEVDLGNTLLISGNGSIDGDQLTFNITYRNSFEENGIACRFTSKRG